MTHVAKGKIFFLSLIVKPIVIKIMVFRINDKKIYIIIIILIGSVPPKKFLTELMVLKMLKELNILMGLMELMELMVKRVMGLQISMEKMELMDIPDLILMKKVLEKI